ncbi:hypothetical protein DFJ77DRAFT_506074 [Powellomyces hirtus]|nr:hypothetical protein DFJ77DRAFT_506074 [Powellomyces hirtus]
MRCTLYRDNSAKAEGVSLISPFSKQPVLANIHLSPSGAYLYVEYGETDHGNEPHGIPDGSVFGRRYISAAVDSHLRPALLRLLAFRNTFAEFAYVHASLLDEETLRQCLQVLRYPTAVLDPDDLISARHAGKKRYKYLYLWIEQCFSTRDPPSHWKYPLQLALFQCGAIPSISIAGIGDPERPYVTTPLACAPSFPVDSGGAMLKAPSAPNIPHVSYTDDTTYHVFPATIGLRDSFSAQVQAFTNDIVISCDDDFRFLNICRKPSPTSDFEDEMYPCGPILPVIRDASSGESYPIAAIVREMIKLQQLVVQCHLKRPAPQRPATRPGTDHAHRTVKIPGTGTFTTFSSGRIRGFFEDGVVAELLANSPLAEISQPNGDKLIVRAQNPIGSEQYVRPLLRFAHSAAAREEGEHGGDGPGDGLQSEEAEQMALEQVALQCLRRNRAYLIRTQTKA